VNKDDAIILLVEDEPTLQFVFDRQLQKLGYKVAGIAGNGLTAVEMVLGDEYHLVFMDVRLPGLDGMSATSRIRAAERETGRHTNIVGLTAFAERERCLESGMDDFLQKPVLLEQLDAMLAKWLSSDNQHPVPEPAALPTVDFQQTASKLESMQERISNLRKRVGLDVNTKDN